MDAFGNRLEAIEAEIASLTSRLSQWAQNVEATIDDGKGHLIDVNEWRRTVEARLNGTSDVFDRVNAQEKALHEIKQESSDRLTEQTHRIEAIMQNFETQLLAIQTSTTDCFTSITNRISNSEQSLHRRKEHTTAPIVTSHNDTPSNISSIVKWSDSFLNFVILTSNVSNMNSIFTAT